MEVSQCDGTCWTAGSLYDTSLGQLPWFRLKLSPKVLCVGCVSLLGGVKTLRVDVYWRSSNHKRHALKNAQPLPLALSFPAYEVQNCVSSVLPPRCAASPQTKAMVLWTETFKIVRQNKSFLFMLIISDIYYSNRKLSYLCFMIGSARD